VVVSAFTKKMPYLDIEDTLEEVGITRRQLNYWIEKELFTPELGADAKKFTARDIKLLKFARRLIVDQQFQWKWRSD
jgi:DNA-binding transcriptional MerR regulator